MEHRLRGNKPTFEKENQQKFVNKRTDLLASLHNIKLPLHHSQSLKDNQFQSVPLTCSLSNESALEPIHSYRQHKFIKFSAKQISLTEDYCKTYGIQVESALKEENGRGKFLANHKIDGTLRARMLDWMVEVMSSYHFHNKTYFAGVEIMDRFFQSCSEVLVPTQLHIIGVQAMFIATKMEEVYPLKMKTVFEKIAHKKISMTELTEMENKIAQGLDFCLVSSTVYDLALTKIARHLTESDLYTENVMKDLEELCACVTKFIYYNYDLLTSYDKQILATVVANYALESYKLERLCRITSVEQECREELRQTMSSFKKKFKGLNNILKFADKKALDKIQIPI